MKINTFTVFLFMILFGVMAGSISAINFEGMNFYNFSDNNDLWGSDDLTNFGADSISNFPIFNQSGNSSPNSFNFDGATEYLDYESNPTFKTISFWMNTSFQSTNNVMGQQFNGVEVSGNWRFLVLSNVAFFRLYNNGASPIDSNGVKLINDSEWHHIVLTTDGVNQRMYVDGILEDTDAQNVLIGGGSNPENLQIGRVGDNNIFKYYNGDLDNIKIYNVSLNISQVQNLYNCNNATTCVSPLIEVNDSVESTAVVKQVGTVTLNGPAFTTIFSSDFNVTVNNTDIYGVYKFNVQSNQNNELFCELLIDGGVVGNVSRTNQLGVLGSVSIASQFFTLENGTHSQELRCQRIGAGFINVNNAVGIGHFMIDEFNNTVPHDELNFTGSVASSSFVEMAEINFTISNRTTGGSTDIQHFMVLDWSSNYVNNNGGTEVLNTFINITPSLTNCSFYPRTVESGGVGSVSGDCLIRNATQNQTYKIEVFGIGSNADYVFDLKIKEFLLSPEEIEGGTVFPVNTSFIGLTRLFNITGGNLNHGLTNVFEKVAFSIRANESTTANFFVRLVNGTNFTTINFTRDITTDIGVINGHDILENVPQDTYSSELWADCGNANCTIVGGDGIGYLTDITTTVLNAFNISAFDSWDDSSISNFTANNGASFSTTTGSLLYFTTESFVNITVSSDFNGGYFNNTLLNHDTNNDLNVSLNQSIISFSSTEKITGNVLSDVNYFINGTNLSVFNLRAGSYNVTAVKNNYFNLTQEISILPLDNKTVPINGLFNLILNLTVKNLVNNSFVQNFSGTFFNSPFFSEVFNTTTSYVELGMIQNLSYNVQLNPILGLASTNNFLNLTSLNTTNITLINATIGLFTNNSINFSIFNLDNLSLFQGLVNITLIGSTITFFENTTNGILYIDNLPDDTYKVFVESASTDRVTLFVTVANSNHQDVSVFINGGKASKDFLVQDNLGVFQASAVLSFFQLINGTFVSVGQTETDFSGRSSIFLDETIDYSFFVAKTGFNTLTGNVTPTQPEYTVIIFPLGFGIGDSIFDDIAWSTPFSFVPGNSFAIANFSINSASGSLEFFGMNTSYLGNNFSVVNSVSPSGGIEVLNITGIDLSLDTNINITYFFKPVGSDLQVWNTIYFLSNITGDNISVTGGMFNDLTSLPKDNPVRGLVGFFLIMLFILIFGITSRDATIAIVGGIVGLGINWRFDLLPRPLLIVSMIVAVILLIADNVKGGGR